MAEIVLSTLQFLRFGLQALAFRRIDPAHKALGPEIVILALLNLVLMACVGASKVDDDVVFSAYGVSAYLAAIALQIGLILLLGVRKRGVDLLSFVSILLAMDLMAMVPLAGATVLSLSPKALLTTQTVGLTWLVRQIAAVWIMARRTTTIRPCRFAWGIVAAGLAPMFILPTTPIVAGSAERPTTSLLQAGFHLISAHPTMRHTARFKPFNVEATFARQSQLIDVQLDNLAKSHPGRGEFYFIGMATYSEQDVFKREVASSRAIMDERFGTQGHSVLLQNHRDTTETLPLATAFNLERVLWRLAQVMDIDNDVLVLFITTHGAEGRLSVVMSGFLLDDLTPEQLADILTRTGIHNKVIILSACHAGSFVSALAGTDTLVMAAARTDRASFGCSNEREWIYFGDALFNHALRQTHSLIEGFENARALVGQWETDQHLSPASEPQVSVGASIAVKLNQIATRLDQGTTATVIENTLAPR